MIITAETASFYRTDQFFILHDNINLWNEFEYFCCSHPVCFLPSRERLGRLRVKRTTILMASIYQLLGKKISRWRCVSSLSLNFWSGIESTCTRPSALLCKLHHWVASKSSLRDQRWTNQSSSKLCQVALDVSTKCQAPLFYQRFVHESFAGISEASEPYKTSPGGYILVSNYKLQIPAPFRSSKNSHSARPRKSTSHQVLFSTIIHISNFHTSNLVQPSENLVYQNQAFVLLAFIYMLKDGNWVTFCSWHALVSVGDVDVGLWELGARRWDENFGGSVDCSCRWVGRDDGDGCVSDCRAVRRIRDVLYRERGTQFM